jgi:hypothetical protein
MHRKGSFVLLRPSGHLPARQTHTVRPRLRCGANPVRLVEQPQSVNALAPRKMCRVMTKYGSDKVCVQANPRNQDPSLYHWQEWTWWFFVIQPP